MTLNKTLESQQQVYPQFINPYPVEDEISLIDLWIALLKFKKVFFISFLLLLVLGATVVSLFKTEKYNMTSTMSIGEINIGGAITALQPPEAVLSKINISILPSLTRSTAEKENIGIFSTTVKNPKSTNLVVIENMVNGGNREVFADFQRTIIDSLLAEHMELSKALDSKLRQELEKEVSTLEKMKNPRELVKLTDFEILALEEEKIKLIKLTDKDFLENKNREYLNRIQIFEDTIQVLRGKSQSLQAQVDALQNSAKSRVEKSILMDSIADNELVMKGAEKEKLEIEHEYNNFKLETSHLANRQKIQVDSLKSEIELIESNWKADIKEQESKIAGLKNQLKGGNSRVISIAELSLKPVGLTKNLAYVIVVFLSVFAAFFITLLAMFRVKVNERLAEEK